MEAEVTGKLLRRRLPPVRGADLLPGPRPREEGKKITWRDGVEAIWILFRERFRRVPASAHPTDSSTH